VVTSALNNAVFSLLDAELPLGYIDLLMPRTPGIIADRGLLALLAGTIIITAFRIGRPWTPAAFLAAFGILARIAGGDVFGQGDALFALCSGGTVAAAFILAAEPASGPKSRSGALLAAAAGGALSALFRFRGRELYGCFFALALVNVCSQLIRLCETRLFYLRKRRSGEAAQEGPS
jgi:electron transport complex protein RnfD